MYCMVQNIWDRHTGELLQAVRIAQLDSGAIQDVKAVLAMRPSLNNHSISRGTTAATASYDSTVKIWHWCTVAQYQTERRAVLLAAESSLGLFDRNAVQQPCMIS